jgi:3-dehydroquinate synthase
VLADVGVLASLPPRELRAGYAEIAKYGLLGDPDFFDWLESHHAQVLGGEAVAQIEAVLACCAAKARFVAGDERERGERALLNLGHTFGHALEAEAGFDGTLLHGEAVAIGMVMAFRLAADLGFCPGQDVERMRRHLALAGLATTAREAGLDGLAAEAMLHHMRQDKKVRDGRLTFVLVRGIGQAFLTREVDEAAVRGMLERELAA